MERAHRRWPVMIWLSVMLAAGFYLRVHHLENYAYSPDELAHLAIANSDTAGHVLESCPV